jgi:hypothetical protein
MHSFLNCQGDEKGAEKQIANLKLGQPGKTAAWCRRQFNNLTNYAAAGTKASLFTT